MRNKLKGPTFAKKKKKGQPRLEITSFKQAAKRFQTRVGEHLALVLSENSRSAFSPDQIG